MIVLGRLAMGLTLVLSLASIFFLAMGMRWDRRDFLRNGYYAAYGLFLTTVIASAVLLQAFLKSDLSFAYVVQHSDADLSVWYHIAGFWAGQEGSFLFWLLLIAAVVVILALRDLADPGRLTAGAVLVLAGNAAVFAALMVFDHGSNPFVAAPEGAQATGLNPLLLHPGMVLHPPATFLGYVGLAVPFAFGISALLLGRPDKSWVRAAQKWAVAGWLFLTLGIGLGAWWAYVVLSFGGYWAWDPVENTSLVPWLTATALLHSMTLYKARGMFKRWALALAAATFWFTILATWTTRTGLIQSVHAFGTREVLVWILSGFLVAVAAASVGLLAWRWRLFASHDELESLLAREFIYYLTNLLLTLFAAAIAFATVAVPLLFDRTVGPATYDAVAQPLGVVTLALIAVCPLLAWRRTEGAELRRTLILPAVTAALSVPLWLYLGFQENVWGFIGLVVCGFAFGAVVQFVLRSARKAAGPDASLWTGLGRAFTGSRTRTAAYIVHLGMVLIVAGLLGSSLYKHEQTALLPLQEGEQVTAEGYTLTFTGIRTESGAQGSDRIYAALEVKDEDGNVLGTIEPHTDIYPMSGPAVRAVILGRPLEDLFVVTDEPFDAASERLALRVVVFPLIRWVWAGSILLCIGAIVSLWPARRRRTDGSAAADAT